MRASILLALALPICGATYYVDQTAGVDTNNGTSTGTAWKTVNKVNISSFAAGDQILFKRGEVWREVLTIPSSGASGNPITIGDYGTGTKPTFYGAVTVGTQGACGTGDCWTLFSGSIYYVPWTFASKLVWQNDTALAPKASTGAMTAGSFFYDSGASRLYVWTTTSASPTGFTVEATRYPNQYFAMVNALNSKNYLVIQNLKVVKSNWHDIMINNGGQGHLIRWNETEKSYHSSIQVAGQLQEANQTDVIVTGNTITDSGRGRLVFTEAECVGVNAQGWQGGTVSRNLITNQGGEGIQVLAGAANVVVEYNTIINPYVTGVYSGAGWGNGGHVTNTTVRYNYVELGAQSISPAYTIATEHALSPVTANTGTDVLTSTYNFTFINDYPVRFSTSVDGTLPAPLVEGTLYYLRDVSGATFKLAATAGGSVIDITTTGTGTHTIEISHRVDGVIMHHNVAKGNGSAIGGLVFGSGAYYGVIRDAQVYHNVFVNDQIGIKAIGPTDNATHVFANNIISILGFGRAYWIGTPTFGVNPASNYNIDNDVVYGPNMASLIVSVGGFGDIYTLAGWRTLTGHATNTVGADPLFVNIASDWRLQSTSPAIGAGRPISGIGQDRAGIPDPGVYEFSPGKLGSSITQRLRNRHRAVKFDDPIQPSGFFASPSGSSTNPGTFSEPYDLETALNGTSVPAGNTLWLRGGTYSGWFVSNLTGTSDNPITVRGYPGERAIISDTRSSNIATGGPTLHILGAYTTYRDFEVTNSDTTRTTASDPSVFNRPQGIEIQAPNTKVINLFIYETGTAIGFWKEATNSEVYGNIIYHNGWTGPTRGHGHGVYAQNNVSTGNKIIKDNVVFNQYGWGLHIYPNPGNLHNIAMEGNIVFDNGSSQTINSGWRYNNILVQWYNPWTVGGVTITNNFLRHDPAQVAAGTGGDANMLLGFDAPDTSSSITITGNYAAGGKPTAFIDHWNGITMTDNAFHNASTVWAIWKPAGSAAYTWNNNVYLGVSASNLDYIYNSTAYDWANWKTTTGWDAASTHVPGTWSTTHTFVRPNTYETGRGHIVVYNWAGSSSVSVDLSTVLTNGQLYSIYAVGDLFGTPVATGTYSGASVSVPIAGSAQFAAFLVRISP